MIGFVIPTWNRADFLKQCVVSIASQSPDSLVICDNASTDHTPEVAKELMKQFPFVSYVRYEEHVDSSESYKRAVSHALSPYTWTFGDDDILLPNAIMVLQNVIQQNPSDFYHVAESKRCDKMTGFTGTMLEICNRIGFLDFTGFISCNIVRTDLLKRGVNSENWPIYSKSSFPQSLALMEVMHDKTATMLQIPAVQSADETDDTRERWKKEQICWRYLYIGDGLKKINEKTPLGKVSLTFFRYGTETLFARIVNDVNYRSVSPDFHVSDDDWNCFEYMINMIGDEHGEDFRNWFAGIKSAIVGNEKELKAFSGLYFKLVDATNNNKVPVYPHTYFPD